MKLARKFVPQGTSYCVKRFLLSLLFFTSVFAVSCTTPAQKAGITIPAQTEPVVILYSASWCGWCKKAEKFLIDNKIRYIKKDIEDINEFNKLEKTAKKLSYERNLNSIPLFIIGDKMFAGFRPLKILSSIGRIHGVTKTALLQEKKQHRNGNVESWHFIRGAFEELHERREFASCPHCDKGFRDE